jgi:hypothetical protein
MFATRSVNLLRLPHALFYSRLAESCSYFLIILCTLFSLSVYHGDWLIKFSERFYPILLLHYAQNSGYLLTRVSSYLRLPKQEVTDDLATHKM